jgi:hypothetical protein
VGSRGADLRNCALRNEGQIAARCRNGSYALDAVEGYAFTLETGAQLLQGQQGAADAADARYGVDVAQNKMRTAGGGTLKLDGADFYWSTTVAVGGAACTDVMFARPANRSLTCTYPAGVGTEREIVKAGLFIWGNGCLSSSMMF